MTCPLWDGYQDMLPKNSEGEEISEGDSHLMLNWLNELDVVFYEIEGEIKCFVLKEFD